MSKSSEVKGLPSQAEFVRQRLSEAIMTGELAPGSFLSEGQIADDFGVSRTPVREAIRILAGDGLVTLRPRQRAIVRGQTASEIIDQFEAMAELEAACARLAARRRSEGDIVAMERTLADCLRYAELDQVDDYYSANLAFHEAIFGASGNTYLTTETRKLRDRLRFLRISQGRLPGRLTQSSQEHSDVLEAIRAQDATEAAQKMRSHLIIQGESLRAMLKHTDASGVVHLIELRSENSQRTSPEEAKT